MTSPLQTRRGAEVSSNPATTGRIGIPILDRSRFCKIALLLVLIASYSAFTWSVAVAADQSRGRPTLTTDRSDYPPHMPVLVSGSGWRPGETVKLLFHETNGSNPDVTFQSVADNSGKFSNSQFAPKANDYGVIFLLTA